MSESGKKDERCVSITRHEQANLNKGQATLVRATGATFRVIAAQLNYSGYRTQHGKAFHPMGVQRLLPKPSE